MSDVLFLVNFCSEKLPRQFIAAIDFVYFDKSG